MEQTGNISRFVKMHRRDYARALSEIKAGRKESHWMWYIFPQVRGLGKSYMSQEYGIRDLAEARTFSKDPYLGGNLTEICNALLRLPEKDPVRIFGPIDARKLMSSMTLFECAAGKDSVFAQVLEKYFHGKRDYSTYRLLGMSRDMHRPESGEKAESVIIRCDDDNIDFLRRRYPEGLHFAVGDIHGETETLRCLMKKIRFDPKKDHVYFIGDYNEGGNPYSLLGYLDRYYQEDLHKCGFHMIRGNHERELNPIFPLENLPDILVIRGRVMNYFLAHAGMVASAFDLISRDMEKDPEERAFAYRLDDAATAWDAPLRQIVWSRNGLYSRYAGHSPWPSVESMSVNRACVIHGHSPYCFFKKGSALTYGRPRSVFWEKQHVFFSESLQSFNIDSNIKGRYENNEGCRGLSCICLEVLEEIAAAGKGRLMIEGVRKAENFVFSYPYTPEPFSRNPGGELCSRILRAEPSAKTITLDAERKPCFG